MNASAVPKDLTPLCLVYWVGPLVSVSTKLDSGSSSENAIDSFDSGTHWHRCCGNIWNICTSGCNILWNRKSLAHHPVFCYFIGYLLSGVFDWGCSVHPNFLSQPRKQITLQYVFIWKCYLILSWPEFETLEDCLRLDNKCKQTNFEQNLATSELKPGLVYGILNTMVPFWGNI